jgi:hypothetical protein
MWTYSEDDPSDDCPNYQYDPVSGEVGILQTGSTFLIVDDDFSTYGNVSGNTYKYSDIFCFMEGVVSENDSITLTSETTGTGTVSWSWSGDGQSCSGDHEVTLSKQTQAAAVYDATGKWNFNQSGFFHNCDSASTPRSSGYFEVTQTGNKITAVDDQGQQYSGFVNGAEYAVVRSYGSEGGRNTEWVIITLSSGTQGSGTANFVWDDDCDDCNGSWSISVTKVIPAHTITASAGPGGSISPSGSVSVNAGSNKTFTIKPDSGYKILDVKVDGTSVGAKTSYTFSSISSNHTIAATFALKPSPEAVIAPILSLLLGDDVPQ